MALTKKQIEQIKKLQKEEKKFLEEIKKYDKKKIR